MRLCSQSNNPVVMNCGMIYREQIVEQWLELGIDISWSRSFARGWSRTMSGVRKSYRLATSELIEAVMAGVMSRASNCT